jgi:hypothetical protein
MQFTKSKGRVKNDEKGEAGPGILSWCILGMVLVGVAAAIYVGALIQAGKSPEELLAIIRGFITRR